MSVSTAAGGKQQQEHCVYLGSSYAVRNRSNSSGSTPAVKMRRRVCLGVRFPEKYLGN